MCISVSYVHDTESLLRAEPLKVAHKPVTFFTFVRSLVLVSTLEAPKQKAS